MKYFNTITQISVSPADINIIYGGCTRVRLEDERGGLFLVIEQSGTEDRAQEVRIALDEWDSICQAVLTLKNQKLVKNPYVIKNFKLDLVPL